MGVSDFFQSLKQLIKSSVTLPFIKSFLNTILSPYLYPLKEIAENDSVVELTSVRIKVDEINRIFFEKYRIIELKEAKLDKITLGPMDTLIYYESKSDPCHVTLHNLYSCVQLKDGSNVDHLEVEKFHELATDVIGDILGDWIQSRERANKTIKEMKVQGEESELASDLTLEEKVKAKKIVDNIMSKLEFHIIGATVDFIITNKDVIRVSISRMDYKDVTNAVFSKEFVEKFDISVQNITASALCKEFSSSSELVEGNSTFPKDSSDCQPILKLNVLKSRINLSSDRKINVAIGMDGFTALFMPDNLQTVSRVVDQFIYGHREDTTSLGENKTEDLHNEIQNLVQKVEENQQIEVQLSENLYSSSNNPLYESFLDENPQIEIKTEFLLTSASIFFLYDNHKYSHQNLVPAAIFDSENVRGLHLKVKSVKLQLPERRKLCFDCPFLFIEEFIEGKNTTIFSRNPISQITDKSLQVSVHTEKESSFREVVKINVGLEDSILKIDVDIMQRILSTIPESLLMKRVSPAKTNIAEKKDNSLESMISLSLKGLRFDVNHKDSAICTNILNLTIFHNQRDPYFFDDNIISETQVKVGGFELNLQLDEVSTTIIKSQGIDCNLVSHQILHDYPMKKSNPRPSQSASDRISHELYQENFIDRFKHSNQYTPTSLSVNIEKMDTTINKILLHNMQDLVGSIFSEIMSSLPKSENPPDFIYDKDISKLVYDVVPEICISLTFGQFNLLLKNIPNSQSQLLRSFTATVNGMMVLVEKLGPSHVGNTKLKLYVECDTDMLFTELIQQGKFETILRTNQNLVKDFRIYKNPVVASLEIEKNLAIDRFRVHGKASTNGLYISHFASPNIFIIDILNIVIDPNAPPPAISDINFQVSVSNSIFNFQTNDGTGALVFVADSLNLQLEQKDPPSNYNLLVALQVCDNMNVFVHRNFSPVIIPPTFSKTNIKNHIIAHGFSPVLKLQDMFLKVIVLGDKLPARRDCASNQISIEGGSISLKGCKDSILTFIQTVQNLISQSTSVLPETPTEPTELSSTSNSPSHEFSLVDSYFSPDDSKRITVTRNEYKFETMLDIVEDFFIIPGRYHSTRSNSCSPLGKYLQIPKTEISFIFDVRVKVYEGSYWNSITIWQSPHPLKKRSHIYVHLSELFLQLDLFNETDSRSIWSRFSLYNLGVYFIDENDQEVTVLQNKTKNVKSRVCDGSLQVRRDGHFANRINFEISKIHTFQLNIPLNFYRFLFSLLTVSERNLDEATEEDEEIKSEFKEVDVMIDTFRIAPLSIIANIPFLTMKNVRISLLNCSYSGIMGSENLVQQLVKDTFQNLVHLPLLVNAFTSMFFLRNIRGITDGTYDLIKIPYTHIRDGRILYGMQLGITSFLLSLFSETVDCTSDITYILGEGIQKVKNCLYEDNDSMSENSPMSASDAFSQAKIIFTKSMKGAYQPIIAIPTQYRKEGTYAVANMLLKMVPVLLLSPSAGVFRSISLFLYGLNAKKHEEE